MKHICQGCGKPSGHGELWSGVRVNKTRYVFGHYQCVMDLLGPALTLKAIQRGYLPNVPPEMLVDGKLPKFTAPRPPAFEDLE